MKYQHIIFDFDGVLVESNEIRFNGFRKLFKDYPQDQIERLVSYAKANGGVSRYKKIEYFFNDIRQEPVSDGQVDHWAVQFSELVEQDIVEAKSVEGSLEFLREHSNDFNFAIDSGLILIGKYGGFLSRRFGLLDLLYGLSGDVFPLVIN